jgi:hypothetical protein
MLISQNGRYELAMQPDGNLVEYVVLLGRPIWWSNTSGHPGAYAVMQSPGNLVVYSPQGRALWWNSTGGQAGSHLALQNDANLVIYAPSGRPTWATYVIAGNDVNDQSRKVCLSQTTAGIGGQAYSVCLDSIDSFNRVAATGVVSGVYCDVNPAYRLLGYNCNTGIAGERHGSYWDSRRGVWEDWLNYRVWRVPYAPPYKPVYADCVYLRVDTRPGGSWYTQSFSNTGLDLNTKC